jgi:two-component system sensor histidine kinase KdpD
MVGVIGIQPEQTGILSNPEQRQILDSFANQAALAVERTLLEEQARQAEILKVTEKLQTSLLNSISHDLRTPLVSITGALSSLRAKDLVLDQASRETLLDTAFEEAERLNRLVGNLLNMTRIEAGAIHLQKEPCDIQDALGAALEQLGERLQMREVQINLPPDLGLVMVDIPLFEQVLVNLLDNAVKYSTEDTAVEINVVQAGRSVQIDICDRGIGIPEAALELIFDKFYRVQRPERVNGTGLGLAICRGIVEAHGGTIVALNRPGGGSVLRVILPKATSA